MLQAVTVAYDEDTGVLDLALDDGSKYQITNAGHARRLKEKISIGGVISEDQRWWLQQYKMVARETNRDRLRARLRDLRREIREL